MSHWYSAKELAGLPGVPGTDRRVRDRAERENWESKPNRARGGGRLYALTSLPTETQTALVQQQAKAVVTAEAERLPVRQEVQLPMFETQQQALIADARQGVLKAIEGLMQSTGYTQTRCAQLLIDMARSNQVEPYMVMMLKSARDGRGRSSADGLPSARSLLRFIQQGKTGELVPQYRQKDMSVPVWAKPFLEFYSLPSKPSVAHAYGEFSEGWKGELPSIHQVRRFLARMGNVSREVGRMGARELKTLKPFVRRTFEELLPADIYSADGHTFDAEVQHPAHGRPFRPEITSIIDIATRKVVGWSVDLAESGFAVLDALRHACTTQGIPAIFYVDNGSGYKNKLMKGYTNSLETAEGIGLMGRLGIEMTHSLAYNSQARGVIERLHKTLWVTAARELEGYVGHDMDREARLQQYKLSRKAVATGGEAVRMPLMGWEQFIEFCNAKVAAYNAKPHRSLPKCVDPETGRSRHMSPDELWQQKLLESGETTDVVSDDEARPLFRPREIRQVVRCEMSLFGSRYFAAELEEFNGDKVQLAYDIHDPERVWVYTLEGAFLCIAQLGGNEAPYMPMSRLEAAKDNRGKQREKRLMAHLDEIHAERFGTTAIAHENVELPGFGVLNMDQLRTRAEETQQAIEAEFEPVASSNVTPIESVKKQVDSPIPTTPDERWQLWKAIEQQGNQGELDEAIAHWFTTYPYSKEFMAFSRRFGDAVGNQ